MSGDVRSDAFAIMVEADGMWSRGEDGCAEAATVAIGWALLDIAATLNHIDQLLRLRTEEQPW